MSNIYIYIYIIPERYLPFLVAEEVSATLLISCLNLPFRRHSCTIRKGGADVCLCHQRNELANGRWMIHDSFDLICFRAHAPFLFNMQANIYYHVGMPSVSTGRRKLAACSNIQLDSLANSGPCPNTLDFDVPSLPWRDFHNGGPHPASGALRHLLISWWGYPVPQLLTADEDRFAASAVCSGLE